MMLWKSYPNLRLPVTRGWRSAATCFYTARIRAFSTLAAESAEITQTEDTDELLKRANNADQLRVTKGVGLRFCIMHNTFFRVE
jgi:hypothetical protein